MIRWAVKHALYLFALTAGGAVAWAVARPAVEGSGVPRTEERPLGNVTEVQLSGTGEVLVQRGERASVRVTADDNILPLLETDARGKRLRISSPPGRVRPHTPIRYVVTLSELNAVTVSGAGNVVVEQLAGEELKVKLSGAGTLNLRDVTYKSVALDLSGSGKATATGAAGRTTLKLSGAGKIDAAGLRSDHVEVRVSGAGQAQVWAAAELKANVSGAGQVRYKGCSPAEQKVSGAGSVRPLE